MGRKRSIWVALLVVFALVAAACGGDDDATGDSAAPAATTAAPAATTAAPVVEPVSTEPIRIGNLTSFTGPFTPWGIQVRDGMQMAVDEINAAGG
ncbi:MAG: ABC transporter substrate-binding protein, partial [Actinobacteria bacterium]|nr:ABC transporter substrate-binding protein [Actinomycetota bacterium]MBT4038011.1 ABC transporter substrate-binding protein [Actinomycetota bacterium]MBT4278895.1 ABC transporter substrate-binding protein [Actinomycetota bacterium]MBT4342862.1 ABC transporter substrate-binding protein [Actinomycetota bacterium]MBT4786264.1 ABC transporter substrate-binding protein [Actinomycetota bacterium]